MTNVTVQVKGVQRLALERCTNEVSPGNRKDYIRVKHQQILVEKCKPKVIAEMIHIKNLNHHHTRIYEATKIKKTLK